MVHKVEVDEGAVAKDSVNQASVRHWYIVISKAGLFKNGIQYAKGDEIELDEVTGNNFIKAGDVRLEILGGDSDEN